MDNILNRKPNYYPRSPGVSVWRMWQLMRPRHWVKSGFVLVGVLFANAWLQPDFARKAILAAVAFSLISSGTYIINDLFDRKYDANHPQKKSRPLVSGQVSIGAAIALLLTLSLTGLLLGYSVSAKVLIILALYMLLNLAYSMRLKHVVILDVFIIAAGFMLRILAGTVGLDIAPSQWLLICGLMLALFLGFTKRRAELYALNGNGSMHRKVLNLYQPVLLDKMIVVTATSVILTYSLYTMSAETVQYHHTRSLIYTVPFVMYGIFRYLHSLHGQSTGGDPATEIFRDPHILFAIAGWLLVTVWLIAGHAR
jgi:4-hydroxybenzoate polyprenyltransferase